MFSKNKNWGRVILKEKKLTNLTPGHVGLGINLQMLLADN